jgi:colanic acid/amylovoran biosynthesis glycosyltransferase
LKKRVLIILNSKFPYEKSEDFLSNELDYAKSFDDILCFPILVYGDKNFNDQIYRRPQLSVKYFNSLLSYKSKLTFVKLLFSMLSNSIMYKELLFLIQTKRFSLKNVRILFNFLFIANNAIYDISILIKNEYKNSKIFFYSYWMHTGAFVAIFIKDKLKKEITFGKVISRCHRFDLYEYAHDGGYLPMRNYILSQVDEVHSISQDGLNYLEDKFKVNKSKLMLSRLGSLDRGISIFEKSDSLKLVSCSWMRPVKRISSIVHAIAELDIKLDWTHYGDGDEYTIIADLIKRIDNPLINCKLMGACSNEKVLEDYASNHYDIFINVSENEGVPVSIMEAMSFGKIIIATDVGGTSEIVENDINGFLLNKDFTNDQLVSIFYKIESLSKNEFDSMCRQSRRIWEDRCNAEKNYFDFYKTL